MVRKRKRIAIHPLDFLPLLDLQKGYPSIRQKLWRGALWSPSYFAGTCGGAPIALIRQYIEQQRTPQ